MNKFTYEILTGKTNKELIALCKAQKIQRWSGRRKKDLIALLCCGRSGVIEPQRLLQIPEPQMLEVIPETVRDSGPFLETYRLSESLQEYVQTSGNSFETVRDSGVFSELVQEDSISESVRDFGQLSGNSSENVRPLEAISERIPVREQEPEQESEFLRLQRLIEKIQGWPQEKGVKLNQPKLMAVIELDPAPFVHQDLEIEGFLKTIRQKTSGYSRVSNSPLRYFGGTGSKVGLILQHFPCLKQKRVVSLFLGSGSLELVLAQHLGYEVIGYEAYRGLVNVWQAILKEPEQFANRVRLFLPTREMFMKIRQMVLDSPDPSPEHVYFHLQLSYSGMLGGWPSSIYLNSEMYDKMVDKLRGFRAPRLNVKEGKFEKVFQEHPEEFLFLNPPNLEVTDFPHKELRDRLRKHRGGFFLVYNDCLTIRDWYYGYECIVPMWNYTYKEEDVVDKQNHPMIFIVSTPK